MIKVLSNLTSNPYISVVSKFLIDGQYVNNTSEECFDYIDDMILVKLTLSGLNEHEKIISGDLKQKITCHCTGAYYPQVYNITTAIIDWNGGRVDFTDFNWDDNFVDESIINLTTPTGESKTEVCDIDISRALKDMSDGDVLYLGIKFRGLTSNNSIILSSFNDVLEGETICEGYLMDTIGFNPTHKYDHHSFGKCGEVFVDLYDGKQFYSLPVISKSTTGTPLNLTLTHNYYKDNNGYNIKNSLIPNFAFQVYSDSNSYNNIYVVEDSSGFKKFYFVVERTEETYKKYNIKHTDETGLLYVCSIDHSYLYLTEANNIKNIVHYDKNHNKVLFKVENGFTKIQEITNSLGDKLTYTWNEAKLTKIENLEGDVMSFVYDQSGFISTVSCESIRQYVTFTHDENTSRIVVYNGIVGDDASTILNDLTLYFSDNFLWKVFDNISLNYLNISFNATTKKTLSVGIHNSVGTSAYTNSYLYEDEYTRVMDSEGKKSYYYFDVLGRVKTIVDENARTLTYNYDEFENGISKNLTSVSKVQTNSRNLLENHSFENEDIDFTSTIGWMKGTSSLSTVEVVTGGVLGNKCIKVNTNAEEDFSLYQDVLNPQPGTYKLDGFIKHPTTLNLTSSNLIVKLYGTYDVYEFVPVFEDSVEIGTNYELVTKSFAATAPLNFNNFNWYHFRTSKITIPTDASNISMRVELRVSNVESEIYFDDLQLTNGLFDTRYNMIDNGYMNFVEETTDLPQGWEFNSLAYGDGIAIIEPTDIHSSILGENVMTFKGAFYSGGEFNGAYPVKKMYKTLNIKGLSGEKLIYTVFAKGKILKSSTFKAFVNITYETEGEKTYEFDFDKDVEGWQVLTRAITVSDNYSKVVVGVEYAGINEVFLDCFQLYKDTFGTYYNYDSQGNLIESINGDGTSTKMVYNSDNKLEEVYTADGSCYRYTYENGLLTKAKDLLGNVVEFEYDDKKRIIRQTLTSNGEVISSTTAYDDTNNTETYTNEFGKTSQVTCDYLKRVTSQTDPNGLTTNYTYNNKLLLEKLQSTISSAVYRNGFTYDSMGNTSSIVSYGGPTYSIEYDEFKRVSTILIGTDPLENYEYDSNVCVANSQLTMKKLGEIGDHYDYEYNDEGQLVSFKLNGSTLATYSYDDNGNLYELCDVANDVTYHYSYNLNGQLLQEFSTEGNIISYEYDNLGNIQKARYIADNIARGIDYEYPYEANAFTKEGYIQRLSDSFNDELVIKGKPFHSDKVFYSIYNDYFDNSINYDVMRFYDYNHVAMYKLDEINSYRKKENVNENTFDYETWKAAFYYNKTFYAWVKPTAYINNEPYYKTNIFSFNRFTQASSITNEELSYLAINSDGKLIYYSPDGQPVVSTSNTIRFDEWNLVGIKFSKPTEQTQSQIKIFLNNEISADTIIEENVSDINLLAVSNQNNITEQAAHLHTTLDFALISLGAFSYTNNDILNIYYEGKKYLCENSATRCCGTYYYDNLAYDGFDVISLNGSLESVNGLKPYKISKLDDSYKFEKNKVFTYDSQIKRYVYANYINKYPLKSRTCTALSYKLPLEEEGVISLRFKFESSNTEKCILSFKENDIENLGVYITSANLLRLVINNSELLANFEFTPDVWNYLVINYKSSRLQIFLNKTLIYNQTTSVNLKDMVLSVADNMESTKPLNGSVEMVAFKDTFITTTEVLKIINNGAPISVKKVADSIGRVTENIINVNNTNLITTYNYDKTRILSETLPDGTIISYTYDDNGNILTKSFNKDGVIETETYTYNLLGRVTQVIYSNGDKYMYYYNKNGDISTIRKYVNDVCTSSRSHTYNGCRLTMIRDTKQSTTETITYSLSELGFYPTSMYIGGVANTFTWQGKRLVGVGDDISYTYNHQGLRIKKETPNETTTFILEGSKIISMNKDTGDALHRLDFTYDINNQIIGLATSEGNYFYIRDITNNIIGLIDTTGNYVVKYKYDIWGKLIEKEIITSCIASEHNPFVFKGYYYDVETQLFYCNSRYYSPELCRWISPDSIEYLDPKSINGLNLYCYCYNNPISYADPSGNLPFFILTAIIGAVIGVGITAAVDYIPDKEFDLHWGWYVGAGVLGAAIGAGIGMAVSYYATGSIASSTGQVFTSLFKSTSLYRSVGPDELADLKATGKFRQGPNSMEGKFFANSKNGAMKWGKSFNQSSYVKIRVPKSSLSNSSVNAMKYLDAIDDAFYFSDLGYLNSIAGKIWFL